MADRHSFRNVCSLFWQTDGSGPFSGTGFLIGPKHVLTVGHNLYLPRLQGRDARSFNVTAQFPGKAAGDEEDLMNSTIQVTGQWFDPDCHSDMLSLSAFDLGIVVLNKAPDSALPDKRFSLDAPKKSENVALAGYPSFQVMASGSSFVFPRFESQVGPLLDSPFPEFGGRVFYNMAISTSLHKGLSGSPLWRVDASGAPVTDADGQPVVVALHTAEFFNGTMGGGVALTQDLINMIQTKWLAL